MRILYFAWLRETVGTAQELLTPPDEVTTVEELVCWLRGRDARHAAAFADDSVVRCAIDQQFAAREAAIAGAAEIAFFPPLTGG